jgi:hypothetical protein
LSWYFHHLPKAAHKVDVLVNHLAQLVAPVALFAPQPVAAFAAALIVIIQLWLPASGSVSESTSRLSACTAGPPAARSGPATRSRRVAPGAERRRARSSRSS